MHPVLKRQLRRIGLSTDQPPSDGASWQRFLERVTGYYQDADRSRYLLERSLRMSSRELMESNQELARISAVRIERSEARYKELFHLSRIPTWEEDFTPVAARLDEIRRDGIDDLEAHLVENPELLSKLVSEIQVKDVNPAVGHQLRIENPHDLLGPMDASLVVTEGTWPAWVTQLMAIWERLGSTRYDGFVGTRADGTTFHGILEWHAPLVEDVFDYSRVVVSVIDITERVESEQRMQEILKSKDEFLASISHELRTPLTSVIGFAELLRTMGEDNDDERENMLAIIAEQAIDLSDIVEDLLVAARAELGQLNVVSVPINVVAQVNQVLESRAGQDMGLDLGQQPQLSKLVAIGDPQRVRQILRNLLTNAAKYGGPNVGFESRRVGDTVQVSVVDDGPGLDAEAGERIFRRYYRHHSEVGQPGSVGIGLTISRDLARMMGGDLVYERRANKTVFTLTLPAASGSQLEDPV